MEKVVAKPLLESVTDDALVPLMVSQEAAAAFAVVLYVLRHDPQMCEKVRLFLERFQARRQGPLTNLLAALVVDPRS